MPNNTGDYEITGALLKSRKNSKEYEDNYDKIFRKDKEVKKLIDGKAKYTDWNKRADIKAELHFDLIILLDKWGYPPIDRDEVYKEIFEQAENYKRHTV